MTCIITGCALVEEDSSCWCWGDLHVVGESYVFVAVPERGDPWNFGSEMPGDRAVSISGLTETDCHRNVFVFPKNQATLSDAAKEYVEGVR